MAPSGDLFCRVSPVLSRRWWFPSIPWFEHLHKDVTDFFGPYQSSKSVFE
jgi:hypothetical protein